MVLARLLTLAKFKTIFRQPEPSAKPYRVSPIASIVPSFKIQGILKRTTVTSPIWSTSNHKFWLCETMAAPPFPAFDAELDVLVWGRGNQCNLTSLPRHVKPSG